MAAIFFGAIPTYGVLPYAMIHVHKEEGKGGKVEGRVEGERARGDREEGN